MSAMVYAFQGETDAKTVLFQCMQQEAPPVAALFAACSLGILHKDVQLAELVIQELKKYEYDAEHGHHVAFLISQFYLLQNETKLGLNFLIGKVHAHPHRAQLRKVLANYLLKNYKKTFKNHLRVASRIAQSSIILGLADLSK
jgi:superkiller protein 3